MASSYITKVNGVTLEAPASCTWGLHFLSSEESGRDTQSGLMTIVDIAQKRELSNISWAYPTEAQARTILAKFMTKRMMTIEYDDLLNGVETRTFYMSDPVAQVYTWSANNKYYVSLGFNLIEQ
jgi:hypothetical protein